MKIRALLATLALSLFAACGVAFADEAEQKPITDLTPWAGEFVSAETFWTDARTDEFYAKVADEAKAQGKEIAPADVKAKMVLMYHALFTNAEIDATGITFTMKDEGNRVRVDYEYQGPITDEEGGTWYLFTAKEINPENSQLANLVLTDVHGNPAHFHFRNGDVSGQELVKDPVFANWYGTMQMSDITWEQYMEKKDPKRFVKFAL